MDERTGKHQTLLLSAGELVHLRIAFVGDPELLQKLPGSSVRGSQGDPEVSRVEDEVLSRVEVSIRIRSLRNDADPPPTEHLLPRHVGAGPHRVARGRSDAAGEDSDPGRLSRAIGPENAHQL